jgi:hypothetical protein
MAICRLRRAIFAGRYQKCGKEHDPDPGETHQFVLSIIATAEGTFVVDYHLRTRNCPSQESDPAETP